jgi:hypothetical protein
MLVAAVVVVLASWPASVAAQSAATAAAEDLLQSIVAGITVRTPLGEGLCHGFVATVRNDVAYIVTAKHCVESLSPATVQRKWRDPDLAITIAYAKGGTGIYRQVFWHIAQDDLVIAASFTRTPASYTGLCPSCLSYRTLPLASQPFPVLSVLSSAGGLPVLSTGMVLVTESGEWIVLLPSAHGTSGAPVIDLQGNLVGIVSSATIVRGTEAGVMVALVSGGFATDLVRYAVDQVEGAAVVPPPPPPPPPSPPTYTPPTPPALLHSYNGYVLEVQESGDQTVFTVVLDHGGPHMYLSSSNGCPGIRTSDSVTLHVYNTYALLLTADTKCFMHVTGPP